MLIAIAIAGCASGPTGSADGASPEQNSRTVVADWEDVPAAVSVATGQVELAVVDRSNPDPNRLVYELKSIRDEPGVLEVSRPQNGWIPGLPVVLTLRCEVGRFENKKTQDHLLHTLMQRLQDLRGVDAAPIR